MIDYKSSKVKYPSLWGSVLEVIAFGLVIILGIAIYFLLVV